MRNRVLTFGLFLLLASPAALADNWSKSWTVSAPPEVRLVTGRGTITINQVTGNSVRAVVSTTYWRIAPSEVEITESQNGNSIDVQIRTPEEHDGWFHWHSPKVEIELDVPAQSRLDLETGFGDVISSGLQSKARFNSGFGRIHMNSFDGSLDAQTGFGDLYARGRFDALTLKTGYGHIDAEVGPGSRITGSWRLSSGFGNLSLRLSEELNADLHATTGFGHVSSDFPIMLNGVSERTSISGKIGSGGPPLDLDTGFGSVHIGKI